MNSFGCPQPFNTDSNTLYGQQSTFSQSEAHFMPPPQTVPWNMQQMSWGVPLPKPDLVQFTGQSRSPVTVPLSQLHAKRKPQDVDCSLPRKQLITEEKMVAHLNGIHISSDYTSHSFHSSSNETMDADAFNRDLEERLKSAQGIILSDELKNIKTEPIIPATLVQRIERPCMSVVVWQPPPFSASTDDNSGASSSRNPSKVSDGKPGVLVTDITNTPEGSMDVEM